MSAHKAAFGCHSFGASFPRGDYKTTTMMLANSFFAMIQSGEKSPSAKKPKHVFQ